MPSTQRPSEVPGASDPMLFWSCHFPKWTISPYVWLITPKGNAMVIVFMVSDHVVYMVAE